MTPLTASTMPVPPPTEPALASALALARERPAELSVSDLADHAGYSPFHFSRLFTRHAGIGPGQYLTALRIDTAKRLLLTDDEAVIEVATAVGFTSLSSFTRRFRETVGVPPAQLRRLAERISDTPPRPFSLLRPGTGTVHAEIELPPAFSPRGDASIWVGWYPHPAPIGLPHSGTLISGSSTVQLPLRPGAPFLLGFAVPMHADAWDQLAPSAPMVAVHPLPLTQPEQVTLRFTLPEMTRPPLLTALPSLCRR
ncbi:helix-turn-helix transcriptional regulator [Brachybacterium alimentarium]|uniref:helix-turn-helix transcriptional regulator n=1 Tax=Brachybacterium alimentarium TaxID=47845 RepID=UPI002161E5E7|nr:helix-turn-helix transcriptional regulator [Brachybacterium alimentarium]